MNDISSSLIQDLTVKKDIFDFLYNYINLKDFRFIMLDDRKYLKNLKQNWHYVSMKPFDYCKGLNFGRNGEDLSSRCLILFIKYKGENKIYLIDKKTLKYNRTQVNLKDAKIAEILYNVNDCFYDTTILDGYIFRTKRKTWRYYVYDVHYYSGKSYKLITLEDKLLMFKNILNDKTYYERNSTCELVSLEVAKLYSYVETKRLINTIIPTIDVFCTGLIFLPKYSGNSIIYQFQKNANIRIIDDFNYHVKRTPKTIVQTLIKEIKDKWRKTPPSNSYRLTFKIEFGNKPGLYYMLLKYKSAYYKICTSAIQVIKDEQKIYDMYFKNKNENVFCDCIYLTDVMKWKPLNISKKDNADDIHDIF